MTSNEVSAIAAGAWDVSRLPITTPNWECSSRRASGVVPGAKPFCGNPLQIVCWRSGEMTLVNQVSA